ncbi:uncharacterized protein SAPINGB_P000049 [Magnusiomyces paraingens]|uniref:N-acetyltransferase domain-containing protein n=1 Tax=Magnusiomyces paraingens TaxID=2606893 RepID=A0A5E8B1U2_9ASCO|nr:uncharacterized protein SAPINGB_P000049 [Saprochaete ingens]VVT43582.1 unnamed protein product [Saprochaete ingens]
MSKDSKDAAVVPTEQEKEEQEEVRTTLELLNLKEHPERLVESFKVVTDAQAQRRNLTNNVIIKNKLFISSFFLIAAFIVYRIRMRADSFGMDWGMLIMSLGGFGIAMFSIVGRYTEEIIAIAERMDIDEIFAPDVEAFSFIYKNLVVGTVAIKPPPDYKPGQEAVASALEKSTEAIAKMTDEEKKRYDEERETKIKIYHKQPEGTAMLTAWTALRRYRGIGMGSDLLDKAIAVARDQFGAKAITALCESTEKPAIAVLKKKGFVLVDTKLTRGQRGKWFQIKELTWKKVIEPTIKDKKADS